MSSDSASAAGIAAVAGVGAADGLLIFALDVEVTSTGVEVRGEIAHGGSAGLNGFTVTFTGAISGTVTTASDGTFNFVYAGSASGLVEANVSGSGVSGSPYTFFV